MSSITLDTKENYFGNGCDFNLWPYGFILVKNNLGEAQATVLPDGVPCPGWSPFLASWSFHLVLSDLIVLGAFLWIKTTSDLLVFDCSVSVMLIVFTGEKWFLKRRKELSDPNE